MSPAAGETRTGMDLIAERTADMIVKGLLEEYEIRPKTRAPTGRSG